MSPHSRCTQGHVARIEDAISVFNTRNERGECPLVMIPSHRSPFAGTGWWMTIPTGVKCLLQRFGKDAGVAPAGGKLYPPWYRIAYIVNMQSIPYEATVQACPTKDNVRVSVSVAVSFTINDPAKFVYKLGAVHFDQLLSGALDEAIRLKIRDTNYADVRALRGSASGDLLKSLHKAFTDDEGGFVTFSSLRITSVVLPDALATCLSHKTEMENEMKRIARQQELDIADMERQHTNDLAALSRKNEQTIVDEMGLKGAAERARQQEVLSCEKNANTQMSEALTKKQVGKADVDAEFERVKMEMERYRVDTISKAEADAEAKRVKADIAYESALVQAEAEKQKLLGEAKAVVVDSQAEAKASQHLQAKRKHELEMREKQVIMDLAKKGNFNLIGQPGDKVVNALLEGHLSGQGGAASAAGPAGWFK